MFKRSLSVDSHKSKQSSLLDFFSSSASKLPKQQELQNTSKRSATHYKIPSKKRQLFVKSSASVSMEESTSNSCPSRLLEVLESNDELQNSSLVQKKVLPENEDATVAHEPNITDLLSSDLSADVSEMQMSKTALSKNDVENEMDACTTSLFDTQHSSGITASSKCSPSPSCSLSRGIAFNKLQRMPHCSDSLPALQPSSQHTVLFDETMPGDNPPPPRDPEYKDAWDPYHVRLPCSPKNLYPVKCPGPSGEKDSLQSRWLLIESSLLTQINNSFDLKDAILKYNSRYANQWSFRALHKFFSEEVDDSYRIEFFSITLPAVIRLALMLPQICTQPIPLLSRQTSHKVSITQQQIACLLCNAFLCTFPWRNSKKSSSEYSQYPDINFNRLLSGSVQKEDVVAEKLKMIFNYFKRVTTQMPNGIVTFERRSLNNFPNWNQSPCTLYGLHITSEGMIETEGAGMLQVDFANRFIGGGVLGNGSVQEEIRFCICPELIASRLLCEALDDNECILITGTEQFSSYSGYGSTLKWTGDFLDVTVRDNWRRRTTQIVAIDALPGASHQYSPSSIKRELNKAFCGFFCDWNPDNAPAIATGKWGCGAFGGNPMLKSLIQLLAAAAVGRDLCFFTFGDIELTDNIYTIYSFIVEKQLQICDIWRCLIRYNNEIVSAGANEELKEFLKRIYNEYDDSTDEAEDA